jgi:hypothetical protein
VFRRTLALELDADAGRTGRLGEGVLVGHVALGLGLDLDLVVVCGLAEGTFPARVRDDPLLPDHERRVLGGALPLRAARVDDDHRALLAALASSAGDRVLLFPRGDLRRTTERTPSRFLLDSVEALGGVRRRADDLAECPRDWFRAQPSFASGVRELEFPATDQEHRLRVLDGHVRAGGRAADHPVVVNDTVLARGFECTAARAGSAFTRFDGNLAGVAVPSPASPDVAVAPTRLEAWAECPFAYFMSSVLRVDVPQEPDDRYAISALDRGSLVHGVLDAFLAELVGTGAVPPPGRPWTAEHHARLRELAEAACEEYEVLGLTGRRVLWDRDRRRILADLDHFLTEDDRVRAETSATPVASELRFGLPGAPDGPLAFTLSDGRTVRFRGAADRVDRTAAGGLCVVDYKTGRPDALPADDPTARGRRLQLPVYARAARRAYGDDATPVEAAYWFVTSRGGFKRAAVALDDVADRFDEVVRTIVDGIESGAFPCRVDPPSTWDRRRRDYADPDAHGTRDRYREWSRKRHAPELSAYIQLAEPGADDDGEAETELGAPDG